MIVRVGMIVTICKLFVPRNNILQREERKLPEAPELAYSRDRLRKIVGERLITKMTPGEKGRYAKKRPEGFDKIILDLPLKVESIDTKGKFMYWTLTGRSGARWYMHCSYGMSGGWYTGESGHTAFIVHHNVSGSEITRDLMPLFFNDPRHFGTIKFVNSEKVHEKKLGTLGPCILTPGLTPEIFAGNVLRKQDRPICEALMDQSVISGVGNYLRAEALYHCKVNPWARVTELSSDDYVRLHSSILSIAKDSYTSQGATISTYRTVDGTKGTTQFDFHVYGKKSDPDGREVVSRQDANGRTMHWCPSVQK